MRKGNDLTTFIVQTNIFIVTKVVKNLEALSFRIPKGLFWPVAGQVYVYAELKSVGFHSWRTELAVRVVLSAVERNDLSED